eukprot:3505663-Rhodomonas_salina.1
MAVAGGAGGACLSLAPHPAREEEEKAQGFVKRLPWRRLTFEGRIATQQSHLSPAVTPFTGGS